MANALPGETNGSIQLKGNVTLSPFENTLVYRIYDDQWSVLAEGPLQVVSEVLGGPGTFDTTIDLSALSPGTVRLELLDLSAEDGSMLAMDSIALTIP